MQALVALLGATCFGMAALNAILALNGTNDVVNAISWFAAAFCSACGVYIFSLVFRWPK